MASGPTRWGIVGAGNISDDFVNAFSIKPRSEHLPVAVAARDLTRAQAFADKHNVQKAYGSYEELATDPDVEIAYVGVTCPQHLDVVKLMINAGKHVLCEKPLGLGKLQVEEMVSLARSKRVFFMEAIWSRTFPIYADIKKVIKSGVIGDVKRIMCSFGQSDNHLPDKRLATKANGGGTLLDWGVYCIQFCLMIFDGDAPEKITASAIDINESGVDLGITSALHFSNQRMATFNTDLRIQLPNQGIIAGTNGYITVGGPFWAPTTFCVTQTNGDVYCKDFPVPSGAKHPFNFVNSSGLLFEADHVRKCLRDGLLESPLCTLQDTLTIAQVQQEIMDQIGVSYV